MNLLEDTVCTFFIPGTGDTGVVATWGSGFIANVDKINVKETGTTADHSGGQTGYPITRFNKIDSEVSVELKLFVEANTILFRARNQFKMTGVATLAGAAVTITYTGIITDSEFEISGPGTVKFSAKPYAIGGANPLSVTEA